MHQRKYELTGNLPRTRDGEGFTVSIS